MSEGQQGAAPGGAPEAAPQGASGAPSGASSVGEQVAAAVADGTLSEADLGRKVRVKVDGVEREVTLRDAMRDYELRAASHKRLEEAAKTRKEIEAERAQMKQLVELMRDPAGLLSLAQELGVSTKDLRAHIEREASIPEETKRLRDIEKRERALKERDEAEKRAREQSQMDAQTRAHRERYRGQIVTAAKGVGLPESPAVVGRMARLMAAALDAGAPITAEDAALSVREELSGEVGSVLRDADPATLRALLGDKLDALRKEDLAKATPGRDAMRSRPQNGGGRAPEAKREKIPMNLSPEQLTARLNGKR